MFGGAGVHIVSGCLGENKESGVWGLGRLLVWEVVFGVSVVGGSLCGGIGHLVQVFRIKR